MTKDMSDKDKVEFECTHRVILMISYEALKNMLAGYIIRDGEFDMPLPLPGEIPTDVVVVSVHNDFEHCSIAVVLEHESFEPVEPAHRLPIIHPCYQLTRLQEVEITDD